MPNFINLGLARKKKKKKKKDTINILARPSPRSQ